MLLWAVLFITLALIFYTTGVWAEKIHGSLLPWHAVIFWCGLVFDTLGTSMMGRLASQVFSLNFHSVTGALAIVLMLVHAVWATVTLRKGNERQKKNFHRFSVVVWAVWLIPYLSGMIVGMMH